MSGDLLLMLKVVAIVALVNVAIAGMIMFMLLLLRTLAPLLR